MLSLRTKNQNAPSSLFPTSLLSGVGQAELSEPLLFDRDDRDRTAAAVGLAASLAFWQSECEHAKGASEVAQQRLKFARQMYTAVSEKGSKTAAGPSQPHPNGLQTGLLRKNWVWGGRSGEYEDEVLEKEEEEEEGGGGYSDDGW